MPYILNGKQEFSTPLKTLFDEFAGGHDEGSEYYVLLAYLQEFGTVENLAEFDWEDGGQLDELLYDSNTGVLFFSPSDGETPPIRSLSPINVDTIEPLLTRLNELLETA